MELIFYTSLDNVQPYLFRISPHTPDASAASPSMGSAVKKILKDSLAI